MISVYTQWKGSWTKLHLPFEDVESAIDFAKASTTTPWRITRDDLLVAEGHAKRVYRQTVEEPATS